ncbi:MULTISPECIES: MarR family winged helix-turn-helix transcriptional regulator [Thermoactinomyces]|jgi:DNA-binding MarR family transcriptional regulator|uniref:MarR family transcriptional regulator n=1 Tax=Thermoactinomyces daqus TaxID=1329516 RepID=A0A7W2AJ12_9BACL|nr:MULTISPECIES: MarR family transcriptional regulator [Thermoactinomyces]MBA4544336.1 MarR family transcriptional regulator [Thermoactinomyces daqus]MBH8599421.1 MarR family transcriptional regulator [Thermoactinomyces sp. CICC 10523]MBH8605204.1 MarR family transcriptional regulator [Thermoactinomyces sp. CICC 10522]MBH8609363.1 MarR family transcriptional regulator [Thermoactinomyces sp. CICC 10521]
MDKNQEEQLNQVLVMFYFAYKTFTEKPDEIIKEYGIQRLHHRIMFFVARFPGLSVNELLSLLEISKQALNNPLRQLIKKGLITTKSSDQDRRIKQLILTKEGEKLEKKLSQVQRGQMKKVFTDLGEDYQNAWLKVMTKLSNDRAGYRVWSDKQNDKSK